MTEIKDPILAAMEFSLNYTLKRFEDTETEDGKIIREGIIRGKTLVEHLRIFGADVYGKSKEQFAEDIKDKTNIVMMTDEEYKETRMSDIHSRTVHKNPCAWHVTHWQSTAEVRETGSSQRISFPALHLAKTANLQRSISNREQKSLLRAGFRQVHTPIETVKRYIRQML